MKFAIVITLLAVAAYSSIVNGQLLVNLTEEQTRLALKHTGECLEQEKVTMEAAQALIKGQFSGVDHNTKCFANCFLEKAGFIKDGAPQASVIAQKLKSNVELEKINTIMALCNGLKGSDNCETAFEIFKCYIENNGPIVQA